MQKTQRYKFRDPSTGKSTQANLPSVAMQLCDGMSRTTWASGVSVKVKWRSGQKAGRFTVRFYQGGEDGKTWDRKDMLSMGLMAMLSGVAMFMGMGVVMATGWAMFIGADAGMLTEAMFTGPVMVTGCCRLMGDVMLMVLVEMFIWAAMVTGLLVWQRFIAVVMGAAAVTGVVEAELQTSLLSVGEEREINVSVTGLCVLCSQTLWRLE